MPMLRPRAAASRALTDRGRDPQSAKQTLERLEKMTQKVPSPIPRVSGLNVLDLYHAIAGSPIRSLPSVNHVGGTTPR